MPYALLGILVGWLPGAPCRVLVASQRAQCPTVAQWSGLEELSRCQLHRRHLRTEHSELSPDFSEGEGILRGILNSAHSLSVARHNVPRSTRKTLRRMKTVTWPDCNGLMGIGSLLWDVIFLKERILRGGQCVFPWPNSLFIVFPSHLIPREEEGQWLNRAPVSFPQARKMLR